MRRVSRRHFLAAAGVTAGTVPFVRAAGWMAQTEAGFRHGVASGDPLADRVILWTRVSDRPAAVTVRWVVARDPRLAQVVARGEAETGPARDHTVKVDVTGLEAGTTYYYRFETAGALSPIGRTRTLPAGAARRVRLALASCSNLPFGYFNAYRRIAERADLDAVVHLGDYIYEYANAQYGDGRALGRMPVPDREILALEDYRARHAQYKADPDLQELHRQHPVIAVWDDHELTNNAWKNGAQNHNEGEGDWLVRRAAAVRAYFEWMPIRGHEAPADHRIYRAFSIGGLADLLMLDTRLVGREEQAERPTAVAIVEAPGRSLLGEAQERWLAGELARSTRAGATWQVLGQQVMFAPQAAPGEPGTNTDSWDGYRTARDRVFDAAARADARNLVVLTGDVHSGWAYDLPRRMDDQYHPDTGRGSRGVEIVCTSITSPSPLGTRPDGPDRVKAIRAARPHLKYLEPRYRGYTVLDLTPTRLQADWFTVPTVTDRTPEERFDRGFVVEAGRMHLRPASSAAVPPAGPDPAP